MATKMKELIAKLPKAEIHIHIEGSLSPELLFSLAKKNEVKTAYNSLDEVYAAYNFGNLDEFLKLYYQGMSVLLHEEDFEQLAWEYAKRSSEDGVVYVEAFFDPQAHTCRGVSLKTVCQGLKKGFNRAEADFGIVCKLIFSFLRHYSEEECLRYVQDPVSEDAAYARKLFAENEFIAIGLDSSEMPNPPEKFERLYAYCRDVLMVQHTVAHAGEEGPAQYITDSLDILKVDRIDHGVACRTDPALRDRLREQQIALTVCPYSNVDLQVFPNKKECAETVLSLLREGLLVTLNSDDPAYFSNGTYVNAQYELLVDHCPDLSAGELKQLALNSFLGSFLSEEEKRAYCEKVESAYATVM